MANKCPGVLICARILALPDEEGGGYYAEVYDLPGCVAEGATLEEALHQIEDAIISWIKTAKEFDDPIPEPSIPTNE